MQGRGLWCHDVLESGPEGGPVGGVAEQRDNVRVDEPGRARLPWMRVGLVGLGERPADKATGWAWPSTHRPPEERARRRGGDPVVADVIVQVAEHPAQARVDVDRGEQCEQLLFATVEAE